MISHICLQTWSFPPCSLFWSNQPLRQETILLCFSVPFRDWFIWYHITRNERKSTVQCLTAVQKALLSVFVCRCLTKGLQAGTSMLSSVSTVNSCFSAADLNPPFIAESSLDLRCSSHNFSALILLLSPQLITNQSIHRAHLMSSFFCAALGADLCWLDSQVP